MSIKREATIQDLYRVPENGKAEIVNGELVLIPPTECAPGYACAEIFIGLREYARSAHKGRAVGDNQAFIVDLPNRKSFSPHAAFYTGAPAGMGFFQEAPVFVVEVRGSADYGAAVDAQRAAKRADYFAAGTLVVWDVDLLSPDVIRSYRADDAVSGWTFPVDDLFEEDE